MFIFFLGQEPCFANFVLWAFFIYEHDVVFKHLPQAQHSAIGPAQSSKARVRADQSSATQAGRQGWREPRASMSSSSSTARCILETNEEIQICPAYENIQPLTALAVCVMREGFAFISNLNKMHCSFSLSFLRMYFVDACGVRVVFLEHGALGIYKWSVCT